MQKLRRAIQTFTRRLKWSGLYCCKVSLGYIGSSRKPKSQSESIILLHKSIEGKKGSREREVKEEGEQVKRGLFFP